MFCLDLLMTGGGIAQLARVLGSYPIGRWFESCCRYHSWPVGQEVKTPPFHGGIMGSIPVRVTISTAHIWLNKAFCGLFFLPKFRLVRCLSAIHQNSRIHALSLQLASVQKTKRSVHSFGNSRLCVLELMTIYI